MLPSAPSLQDILPLDTAQDNSKSSKYLKIKPVKPIVANGLIIC